MRSPASASSPRRSATACRTSRCSRWTSSPATARSSPRGPGDALFDAFPNSYGTLGYAIRLRIELEPAPAYVALRHVRFADLDALAKTIDVIVERGEHDGVRVDFLDGVMFSRARPT